MPAHFRMERTTLMTTPYHYTVPSGTLPLLSGILSMMDFVHRDMIAIIADLPDEALVWQPASDMGTLSGIICHTTHDDARSIRRAAGEEVVYIAEDDDPMWQIEEDRAQLIARITDSDAVMKRILPLMTVARMEQRYLARGADSIASGGELIAKAAIHTAMHWGHMQMTRQLWEQAHPEFVGSYTREWLKGSG